MMVPSAVWRVSGNPDEAEAAPPTARRALTARTTAVTRYRGRDARVFIADNLRSSLREQARRLWSRAPRPILRGLVRVGAAQATWLVPGRDPSRGITVA